MNPTRLDLNPVRAKDLSEPLYMLDAHLFLQLQFTLQTKTHVVLIVRTQPDHGLSQPLLQPLFCTNSPLYYIYTVYIYIYIYIYIYSSTLVTAGVYLLIRFSPSF
jgi:hypothetical protein